jgi:hypothetical protein
MSSQSQKQGAATKESTTPPSTKAIMTDPYGEFEDSDNLEVRQGVHAERQRKKRQGKSFR